MADGDRRGRADAAPLHLAIGHDAAQFASQRIKHEDQPDPAPAFSGRNLLLAQVAFPPGPGNHVGVDAESDDVVLRQHPHHRLEDAILILAG
jgi:hypothetical protein